MLLVSGKNDFISLFVINLFIYFFIDVEEDQASGKQGTVKSLQLSVYGENFATEYEYEKTSMFTTFQLILFCLAILLAVAVAVLVGVSYYMNRPSNVPPAENPFERLSEEEDFQ